jgi:hypothetical protein
MADTTRETNLTGLRDAQQGLARLFGAVLVGVGIIDHLGVGVFNGRLLGIFRLSPGVNLLHVLTGLLGLFLSRYVGAGTLFNKLGGVIYALVFVVGTLAGAAGAKSTSWAANGLHLLLAAVVGTVGFGIGETRPR